MGDYDPDAFRAWMLGYAHSLTCEKPAPKHDKMFQQMEHLTTHMDDEELQLISDLVRHASIARDRHVQMCKEACSFLKIELRSRC